MLNINVKTPKKKVKKKGLKGRRCLKKKVLMEHGWFRGGGGQLWHPAMVPLTWAQVGHQGSPRGRRASGAGGGSSAD